MDRSLRKNSKTIGDLAELKAACYFASQGYHVSKPIGDNAPYDLIVDIDGVLKKVQVKARSPRNNKVSIELRSCMRGYTHKYSPSDWDMLVIYDIDADKLALMNWDDIGGREILGLRTSNPKNNQIKNVQLFDTYLIE